MCGRFGFFELKYFIDLLRQLELPFEEDPGMVKEGSYNIAPETDIVTLRAGRGPYALTSARWGLIPHWAKEMPKIRPINARAESLLTKPFYRHLAGRNHCLVPASGFYEWQRIEGKKKQPYYIRRADGRPMAFAGLWDTWKPKDESGESIKTCAIITSSANAEMAPLHDRMPVVLEPENWKKWLDAKPGAMPELLVPAENGVLDMYPVSLRVNNPRFQDRLCIERAG